MKPDVHRIEAARARIVAWREANAYRLGTAQFRRTTLALRLLCDLIARDGGSAADRAYVLAELRAINAGERDEETARISAYQ